MKTLWRHKKQMSLGFRVCKWELPALKSIPNSVGITQKFCVDQVFCRSIVGTARFAWCPCSFYSTMQRCNRISLPSMGSSSQLSNHCSKQPSPQLPSPQLPSPQLPSPQRFNIPKTLSGRIERSSGRIRSDTSLGQKR